MFDGLWKQPPANRRARANGRSRPVDTVRLGEKDELMYDRMQRLLDALSTDLLEREEPVRLGVLAAMAGESLFLLGPPGTGKSLIARRLQQAFRGARGFSYLMGRFSTPDEVFGPLSIRALRTEDRYERVIAGYLPDADVVFLDEIWKASPPIQNALLTALNERVFRNGSHEIAIPMKVFVGASNELPHEDEEAAAFWDRFLVRLVLEPVRDADAFARLLSDTGDPYRTVIDEETRISQAEFDALRNAEASVSLPPAVIQLIAAIRESLADGTDSAPLYVSDRRWKKIASLLRMSAVLHGRSRVEPIDCAIIKACAWSTVAERARVEQVVDEQIAERSGHRELADDLDERLTALRRAYAESVSEVVEIDRARPVVYRDEYYRLVPTRETAAAMTTGAVEEQLLVWHGDIDELDVGDKAEVDLFIYDAGGQLVGSQQPRAERTGSWRVSMDGDSYDIETTEERVTSERHRTPTPEERAALARRIEALIESAESRLHELVDEQTHLQDAARRHLFVATSDAAVVVESIRTTARRVGETRLLALELAGALTGE